MHFSSPSSPPLSPVALIRADRLTSALHDRTFSLDLPRAGASYCAVLLTAGTARLTEGDLPGDGLELAAPCLLWTPWNSSYLFRLTAGATGAYVLLGDEVLALAVGHNAESAELTQIARSTLMLVLGDERTVLNECVTALDVIRREQQQPDIGSESLIEGHVRGILVHLWRLSAAGGFSTTRDEDPSAARTLQRFRQLLEVNFRNRWPIARYAETLGMSSDRLHDICQRKLGKPPRQLVQERQMHEARLMLERTTLTLEQIAGALGFCDSAQFSRFFATRAGLPPGRYRKEATARRERHESSPLPGYTDWP